MAGDMPSSFLINDTQKHPHASCQNRDASAERRPSPPPPSKFTRHLNRGDGAALMLLPPTKLQQSCIQSIRRVIGKQIITSELWNMEHTMSIEGLWAAADPIFL
jgi:hypothetical protein